MAETEKERRLTPREVREMRRQEQEEAKANTPVGVLPPGVLPGEELDPKVNPKVGPQDLTSEEREDLSVENPEVGESYGYDQGMRRDQMDGPQAATWEGNDLDKDEQIERNLDNPANLDVRTTMAQGDRRFLTPRAQEEMDRGAEVLNARREAVNKQRSDAQGRRSASKVEGPAPGPAQHRESTVANTTVTGPTDSNRLTTDNEPVRKRGPGRPKGSKNP